MALIEINRDPSRRDLAWFGLVLLIFLGIVGYLVGRAMDSARASQTIWGVGVVLAALYYAVPPVRKPMFVGWMYAAYPIGYVMSHVLLGMIYFGLLTPLGWMVRAFGHDAMQRQFDRSASTYWLKRDVARDVNRYFRQF